jgi:hypothetical protein
MNIIVITGLTINEAKKVPQNPKRLLLPIMPDIKLKITQPKIKTGFNIICVIICYINKCKLLMLIRNQLVFPIAASLTLLTLSFPFSYCSLKTSFTLEVFNVNNVPPDS